MTHRVFSRLSGTRLFQAGCVLVSLILLLAGAVSAQINTGRIDGTVRDASGAVVPESRITVTNDATGTVSTAQASAAGEYIVNFLVPGTYHVVIEKVGFQRSVTSDVVVNAGGITRVDPVMAVGQMQQSVQVAANPLAVATETSELSKTFDFKQIDELPNIDRNPLYQMNLLPGANNDVGSGNYGTNGGENGSAVGLSRAQTVSLGGIDANANSVFIEGIFNREPQNAYIGLVPPIEAIQEVQIYTGKYNAEFGFSGSAVINIVTKGGTNEFHGALFEYLRNNAADARNFFAEQATPFRRNQFGGAIGGPIKQNKLFFFGDYQGTRFNTSSPGFTTAPTAKMYTGDFSELRSPWMPPGILTARSTIRSRESSMPAGTSLRRPLSRAISFLRPASMQPPPRWPKTRYSASPICRASATISTTCTATSKT